MVLVCACSLAHALCYVTLQLYSSKLPTVYTGPQGPAQTLYVYV